MVTNVKRSSPKTSDSETFVVPSAVRSGPAPGIQQDTRPSKRGGKTVRGKRAVNPSVLNKLVTQIDQATGVKVAAKLKPVRNAYVMSAQDALDVARRVGLLTKTGKLAPIFK